MRQSKPGFKPPKYSVVRRGASGAPPPVWGNAFTDLVAKFIYRFGGIYPDNYAKFMCWLFLNNAQGVASGYCRSSAVKWMQAIAPIRLVISMGVGQTHGLFSRLLCVEPIMQVRV